MLGSIALVLVVVALRLLGDFVSESEACDEVEACSRTLVQFAGVFALGVVGAFVFCCGLGCWLCFFYGVLDGGVLFVVVGIVIVWFVGSSDGFCHHVADGVLGRFIYV